MDLPLTHPWLVAAWPGMGGIAQIAGRYLVHALAAEPLAEVPSAPYFEVQAVDVSAGLIQPAKLPRNQIFGWKNPGAGPDLAVFVGDEQPPREGYRFCNAMLDLALELGVERILTFAAMATPLRPEAEPRVFAAVNRPDLLELVREQEVEVLEEARINGLNGVLLAAAAERGLGGVCLLGEFPYFARAVANPKASAAVLSRFSALAGIPLDLAQLDHQAEEVERMLSEHLTNLERAAALAAGPGPRQEGETPADWPQPEGRDPEAQARIETLFEEAARDRSRALALKAELDRQGLFSDYEDRFLDLFKQAE